MTISNLVPKALLVTLATFTFNHAHAEPLSRSSTIMVKRFDVEDADLGKSKHQDTARAMAKAAPHLVAVDIAQFLRRDGFINVILDESDEQPGAEAVVLSGRFTTIKPGSQAMRVWVGFGAGHSEVCTEVELTAADGELMHSFDICNSGIGWGDSKSNLGDEAKHLGHKIADKIASLAS